MTRPLREARIDLAAISANVATLRTRIGADHTMAVVKARGYGHGSVQSATAALAGGADWLGVADIAEALELGRAGITAPILAWLHGPDADFTEAIRSGVDIGVSSGDQLDRVVAASADRIMPFVQVKVDTGLGRNGVPLDQCDALFARAAELERRGRLRVRGLFSHLANAGPDEDAAQVAAFEGVVERAHSAGLSPELHHLAASAGALRVPAARFDLVRLGIAIYGLSPFDDESTAELGLTPAMELSAAIVST